MAINYNKTMKTTIKTLNYVVTAIESLRGKKKKIEVYSVSYSGERYSHQNTSDIRKITDRRWMLTNTDGSIAEENAVAEAKELAQKFNYQFLGNCNFSDKHRFYIPKNVDNYLGKGDNYCFTSYLTSSFIYIFKVNDELIKTQTDFYQKLF